MFPAPTPYKPQLGNSEPAFGQRLGAFEVRSLKGVAKSIPAREGGLPGIANYLGTHPNPPG